MQYAEYAAVFSMNSRGRGNDKEFWARRAEKEPEYSMDSRVRGNDKFGFERYFPI